MQIDWQKCANLVPVIAQDAKTNEVLMLAYMDKQAFELTKNTGFAHYFSRSKNRIWKKGESSGNTQKVLEILLDCDNDSILLKVEQNGPACHTGSKTCFFQKFDKISSEILSNSTATAPKYDIFDRLYHICQERKLNANAENSYVASLYKKGENAYLKKICEEAGEFAFAVKDILSGKKGEHIENKPEFDAVYEAADLFFHIIVAMSALNIHPEQILTELMRREGQSGIDEKKSR